MSLHVMLVAGEASGDALGSRLMRALRQRRNDICFSGVGGELMAAEGLSSLFPMSELSVMGLTEVLPRLPMLLRRIRQTADAALKLQPDVLVTIDSPSFNLRVARRVRGAGIPVVHYVAPQLWAWRPGRARKLGASVDLLLALLPFEPNFFAGYGVDCTFVGHPVVENGAAPKEAGREMRKQLGIPYEAKLVVALPGSRHSEISRHLPVFGGALENLRRRIPDLHAAVVTVPATEREVRAAVARWDVPTVVLDDREQRFRLFAAADAALAASGTVCLELALAGVPSVIGYRTGPLTAALVRHLILVEHIAMPNILAGRRIIPEFIQEDCTPIKLAGALADLLTDAAAGRVQKAELGEIADALGEGGPPPSLRAADAVLELVDSKHR